MKTFFSSLLAHTLYKFHTLYKIYRLGMIASLSLSILIIASPKLYLNASVDTPAATQAPNQLIVKYKDPSLSPLASSASVASSSSKLSQSITLTDVTSSDSNTPYRYKNIYPGRNDLVLIEGENIEQLMEELKNDPNVEYVEPNRNKKLYAVSLERSDIPNDPDFEQQWSLKNPNAQSGADINFLEALALSREATEDKPIIVAIIDSSFASNHPDLINQLWINEEEIPDNGIDDDNNGYVDDIHGFDFVNLSPNVIGEDDHGTHVAGICAAEKNNQLGISGAFPYVKFIPLTCSAGGNSLDFIGIIRATEYIANLKERGVNIVAVNASYGSAQYSQAEYDSIEQLSNLGILFCTASGNEAYNLELEKDLNLNGQIDPGEDLNGNGILEISYPNSYLLPNIIAVASINQNRELASSSNYGRTEVDLAAPGDSIFSTVNIDYIKEIQDITLSDGTRLENQWIEGSENISGGSLSGLLIDCGLGYPDDFPSEVNGQIALIERGTLFFYEKVLNAMNAGAIATIIYDNVPEDANGLRLWGIYATTSAPWIPSFSISQVDGNALLTSLPLIATLRPYTETPDPNSALYAYQSGTSMASPIVTAAVAFAAHNFPNETMTQRRDRILNNVVTLDNLSDKLVSGGVVNLRKIVDTDEDNLPDWWEMEHFNTLTNSDSQDSDNDGYTNRQEFLAKTHPTLATDTPNFKNQIPIDDLGIQEDNSLQFKFMSYPGLTYKLETVSGLGGTWTNTLTHVGDGTPITITEDDPTSQSSQFYRISVTE